jgi:hypothetical protein
MPAVRHPLRDYGRNKSPQMYYITNSLTNFGQKVVICSHTSHPIQSRAGPGRFIAGLLIGDYHVAAYILFSNGIWVFLYQFSKFW